MTELALFDADQYGKSKRSARHAAPPLSPIETVPVVASALWRLVAKSQPGVVHAFVGFGEGGAMIAYCKKVGVPLTFNHGETVQGCAICAERLA